MSKSRKLMVCLFILASAFSPSLALSSTVVIDNVTYTSMNSNMSYGAGGFIRASKYSSDSGVFKINIVDYILSNRLGANGIDSNTYTLLDSFKGFTGTWYGGGAGSILISEIAGYKNTNEFGYYTIDGNNNAVVTPSSVIFQGGDNAPDSASFSLGSHQDFGFYLDVKQTGNLYYTETFRNPHLNDMAGNPKEIHAAVFQVNNSNKYIIGFEDLRLKNSDADYQDMIVSVTVATPEPGTMLLMGIGAAGAAFMRRRAKRA
ncbi:MAG: PEP-CTERM sorting domain-containing protein [Thermodesulfobacteriota bacterium]